MDVIVTATRTVFVFVVVTRRVLMLVMMPMPMPMAVVMVVPCVGVLVLFGRRLHNALDGRIGNRVRFKETAGTQAVSGARD